MIASNRLEFFIYYIFIPFLILISLLFLGAMFYRHMKKVISATKPEPRWEHFPTKENEIGFGSTSFHGSYSKPLPPVSSRHQPSPSRHQRRPSQPSSPSPSPFRHDHRRDDDTTTIIAATMLMNAAADDSRHSHHGSSGRSHSNDDWECRSDSGGSGDSSGSSDSGGSCGD